jgi:DNA-binding transcriptional ArsR family regulator
LFGKINEKNWLDLYGALYNSTDPDTRQALILLKAYLRIDDQNNINAVGYMPLDDKSRFSEDTRNEILSLLQAEASLTGQQLSAISKTLSDKESFSELKQRFEKDGYSVSVSDEMVQRYVPETKDKKSFEKEIDKQINDISDKIENGDNLDKAELNQELSKLLDKKYVILNESNEKIIDWALSNEDVPTVASKIQQDVFKQFVATAELAEKTEGKKALTILVDDKTGLPKPFPKATQWIEKNVKRLKSFRMWAMLTSPVSWVRN